MVSNSLEKTFTNAASVEAYELKCKVLLCCWLREAGVVASKCSDITDRELDNNIVASLRRRHPHSGQNMFQGMFTNMGHFVQRYRVQELLQRVHPLSCLLRHHQPISHRKFSEPRPNSLWPQ